VERPLVDCPAKSSIKNELFLCCKVSKSICTVNPTNNPLTTRVPNKIPDRLAWQPHSLESSTHGSAAEPEEITQPSIWLMVNVWGGRGQRWTGSWEPQFAVLQSEPKRLPAVQLQLRVTDVNGGHINGCIYQVNHINIWAFPLFKLYEFGENGSS